MMRASGAVIFPSFEDMPAIRASLLLGGRKEREHADALPARLRGTSRRGGIEHALDDRGSLAPIGTVAELTGDINTTDGRNCLDAVIGGGGRDHIPAGGAQAQGADPVGVDALAHAQEGRGGLDVLDTVSRVFETAAIRFSITAPAGI